MQRTAPTTLAFPSTTTVSDIAVAKEGGPDGKPPGFDRWSEGLTSRSDTAADKQGDLS